jgi:general L-amino acid transport system substrate-binding protein
LRIVLSAVAFLSLFLFGPPAEAGPVLDRIKAANTLRCGAEERPGLFKIERDGRARGLLLEMCRAIALSVLPPDGKIEFHGYESAKSFDAVRNNADDVYFLTFGEITEQDLADRLAIGPTVYNITVTVMVPDSAPVKTLADLQQKSICFLESSTGERALDVWFGARNSDFQRRGFREEVELYDSYNAQYCLGLAGESTILARQRLQPQVKHFASRILSEPLAVVPLMATTPVADGEWSTAVAYAVQTVIAAEVPANHWFGGGLAAFKAPGKALGLREDWQKSVVETVGSYDQMYRRTLGEDSPMRLPRGVNAQVRDGGLLLAPWAD